MIFPGVIAGSPKGVTVYVYGSGTPVIHGTYIETGSYDGYPLYVRLDGLRMIAVIDGTYRIADFGDYDKGNAYFFNKNADTTDPWDVSNWEQSTGTTPDPIVSLSPPGTPMAMNISGAGSGGGQPIDIPLVGTLNGKPHYFLPTAGPVESYEFKWTDEYDGLQTTGFAWICEYTAGRVIYKSEDDVATPDLCVWELGNNGNLPLPTVTAVY